jgi:phospholipid/cholesterol/gamma-HCH transport system substrate-binding protein
MGAGVVQVISYIYIIYNKQKRPYMKYFTKEVKIAIVAIVGLVVLFLGMNFLKGLDLFSSESKYYISFKDISGLSSSCPIYADGYQVGVVRNIQYDYGQTKDIIVEASINKDMRIPKGSSAEIVSDLMGNVKVNLLLANNMRERINPGETIVGGINDGAMGQMKDLIPIVQKMLPKLDSILCSVNTLLQDPAIANSLHNVETVTGNLTTSTRQLNTLLGTLNRRVPGLLAKADNVMDNTEVITGKLAKVDVDGTMQKVNTTLQNVQEFTHQLNNNQGSLGLLMRDPNLYYDLNATVKSADSLLIDLKAHPKRYVHFSIFGKKDK